MMPFELKSTGLSIKGLSTKYFANLISGTMEVYVDDLLVKSLNANDHVTHLNETFQILRRYRMRLNSLKCAFGVASGKFLGHMVNQRGIEANPEKICALIEMRSPRHQRRSKA